MDQRYTRATGSSYVNQSAFLAVLLLEVPSRRSFHLSHYRLHHQHISANYQYTPRITVWGAWLTLLHAYHVLPSAQHPFAEGQYPNWLLGSPPCASWAWLVVKCSSWSKHCWTVNHCSFEASLRRQHLPKQILWQPEEVPLPEPSWWNWKRSDLCWDGEVWTRW